MENKTKTAVYWTLLIHEDWSLHIAATSEGLCFVGSQNHPLEELSDWAKARIPGSELIRDDERLLPYAAELIEYLQGTRTSFTAPFDFPGTPF
ncbi:cysteine methyltransferase, partial [Paenibacillus sepulcri]|nr:cysteine methyltransferase [Paenibacillus sepulcri]